MGQENSVFRIYKEKLEDHEFMMGPVQGKLAVLLDILTDTMIVAGKHGIYCRNKQKPEEPSLDMQAIMDSLLQSKELVQAVMEHFRKSS